MKLWPKKLVTVITEKALEEILIRELKEIGVKGYTVTDARGEGSRGVRNAYWEMGANIRVEIVTDDLVAQKICEVFQEKYYTNYAMIIYVSDVLTLRGGKF